ncbi:type IV secretion system protein TraC [Xenorhabdus sp. KJ12.1]|uniref:type IV secretion system protein TraC n=1 Tax=Xenorhabdus sp. KJ12.1 TaxID=1851571 RepID=UPI000C03D688|nr:type IV secretion system protein TraC [Xenorhabdus sp. KJ12.1]PHM72191.1 type-IV secretion system protein TraC [Xenorhabdus sp. KJ12.1]
MSESIIVQRLKGIKRFSEVCPVRAYDEDNRIFMLDNKTVGFGFVCRPLSGTSGKEMQQLQTLLSSNFPAKTIVQTDLIASPNIVKKINQMDFLRINCADPILKNAINNRSEFLLHSTDYPMKGTGTRVRDCLLVYTVKIPVKNEYDIKEEELNLVNEFRNSFDTTLGIIGLAPSPLTREIYIDILTSILNQGGNASWRDRSPVQVQDDLYISDQLLDPDRSFFVRSKYVGIGNPEDENQRGERPTNTTFIKTLSAKKLPKSFWPGQAQYYLGDLMSGATGIKSSCILSMSLIFYEQQNAKTKFTQKRTWVVQQTDGPMVKWIPSLKTIREGYDLLSDKLDSGEPICKAKFSVTIFSNSKDGVFRATQEAASYLNTYQFKMIPDTNFVCPIFLSTLPMFNEASAEKVMGRYRTLALSEALVLTPLYADWQGTRNPALMLTSRSGQVQMLDLFDSDTNYNAYIAAESGSGKSFLANYIITAYRSLGAKVWCIDVGDSYKNICETYGGDYLDFHPDKKPCLNFFELIEDYFGEDPNNEDGNGEEDLIIGLLTIMAAPQKGLDDFQTARLKEHVANLVREHGKKTTVDMVAKSCLSDEDQRVKDIGSQLYPFTSAGQYGKYFVGKNNIDFKNPFTVLELSRLESSEHLKQVVLLQLIYQIQQDMFLGDRSQMKIVVIDEAWALLKGNIGEFIEKGYRRFRKYKGAAITITQSVNDIYKDGVGKAIADNSAFMLLLGQGESAINEAQNNKRLALDDAGYRFLKTVRSSSGVYSEVFVISKSGQGISRLIVDPFSLLLYSTNPDDVSEIKRKKDTGLTTEQAINDILKDRGMR